jgi:alkanesulfonate monooxygenase SsuD/methylene tetrahydromethanopterin reductase-like flavin-dependent oxidoreductase (luciferase family)
VDLLTAGRFRLGVGVGWNEVEYEALGKDFHDRGRRMDRQVELLRRLWTEPVVSSDHDGERVVAAGLAPMPLQRPIPVWFGGRSDPAYRRIGRLGDGWFPQVHPGPDLDHALEVIAAAASEAGRDPAGIGLEGRISWTPDDPDRFVRHVDGWRAAGASHLTVDTMYRGLGDVDGHLGALRRISELLGLTS